VRSPDLVETKLREADYFLSRMRESKFDVFAFYCDFSAYLAASRSVTFALQAAMSGHSRWSAWYADVRARRLMGQRAKFMVEMRNITQKVGDPGITAGLSGPGRPTMYFFDSYLTRGLSEPDRAADVLTLCVRHMGDVVAVVNEWVTDFEALWGVVLDHPQGPGEFVDVPSNLLEGWSRDIWRDDEGNELTIVGSPGQAPPYIGDLVERYPVVEEVV
jgi:hypothetical protein